LLNKSPCFTAALDVAKFTYIRVLSMTTKCDPMLNNN
jgi:hypothetical protein